jgi:hypothetical protein
MDRRRRLASVAVGDYRVEDVRRSRLYRAAIWLVRLMYVCALVFVAGIWVLRAPAVVTGAWLVGLVLAVVSLILLGRSGVRFVRHGWWSWYLDGRLAEISIETCSGCLAGSGNL